MTQYIVKGRGLTPGTCSSELIFVGDKLNIYGDIDADRGVHRLLKTSLKNKIIVSRAVVGSTVAPYITYRLYKRGLAPCGMVLTRVDPVTVAAAVLGKIVLAIIDEKNIHVLKSYNGCRALMESKPPTATVKISCPAPPSTSL